MPVAQIATPSPTPHVAPVRQGRVRAPLQPSLGGPVAMVEPRYRLLGASGRMRGRAHARHLRIRPDSRPQRTPK